MTLGSVAGSLAASLFIISRTLHQGQNLINKSRFWQLNQFILLKKSIITIAHPGETESHTSSRKMLFDNDVWRIVKNEPVAPGLTREAMIWSMWKATAFVSLKFLFFWQLCYSVWWLFKFWLAFCSLSNRRTEKGIIHHGKSLPGSNSWVNIGRLISSNKIDCSCPQLKNINKLLHQSIGTWNKWGMIDLKRLYYNNADLCGIKTRSRNNAHNNQSIWNKGQIILLENSWRLAIASVLRSIKNFGD